LADYGAIADPRFGFKSHRYRHVKPLLSEGLPSFPATIAGDTAGARALFGA
jgi:hypothetical protein